MAKEVRCINKSDRMNAHERILRVGGIDEYGRRWSMTQQEGVTATESARWRGEVAFYVNKGGHKVNVVVAVSHYGHKYLKTESDGEQPNNLLSLPECP